MFRNSISKLGLCSLGILFLSCGSQTSKLISEELVIPISIKDQSLSSRLQILNNNILTKGIVYDSTRKTELLTGYSYGEFYDWDLYFENIYLSYYGIHKYCFTNLDVFLSLQHDNGFIPRSFGTKNYGAKEMFKPFIAQLVVLGSKQANNFDWAEKNYDQLVKYINRWFEYDTDGNGLCYWGEFETGDWGEYHSGMDNQQSRCMGRSEGVDLNSYLVRELRAMAYIAEHLEMEEDAQRFITRSQTLTTSINEILWDNKRGFYFDRNEESGELTKVLSVSGFIPLFAKVASKIQAEILVTQHLTKQNEFWTQYPVPTYASTEPDYYQGSISGECNWRGSTWVPTNYMLVHGLKDYGYDSLAKVIVNKTYDMCLNKNETTREFYNAVTGEGYGLDPFYGWSSLAYFLPTELNIGYKPTSIEGSVIKLFPGSDTSRILKK